ncbi:MAG: molybdopterin-dependent oxidoreductase [Anaerolineae bacterium]|nr:molybdopterin-dependent oxidoreductase [Anaerolineae bacterium]
MARSDRRRFLQGLLGFGQAVPLTTPAAHRSRTINPHRPNWTHATWRLTLHGLIQEREVSLAWADVLALAPVEQILTLECIGNPPVGQAIQTACWRGVWLADLLSRVTPLPGADRLRLCAWDGYQTAIPLALAFQPGAMLAYALNDRPLNLEQGSRRAC